MSDQPVQQPQVSEGILGKTLGEVLQNNDHAQGMIMKAMQITPQQLQEMLQKTGNNQLMNMTIGDLFKSGVVQQATEQQTLTPEQVNQLLQGKQVALPVTEVSTQTPSSTSNTGLQSGEMSLPQQSFIQKVKGFFK